MSPSTGTLEITAVRSLQPTASIVLDLGIPKFTVFSIKFPISSNDPLEFRQVTSEALGVMLDEMAAFMVSTGYKKEVIAKVYALALDCYKGMTANDRPEDREKDPTVGSVRGEFPLPPEFINETQKCVVTAADSSLKAFLKSVSKILGMLVVPRGHPVNDSFDGKMIMSDGTWIMAKHDLDVMYDVEESATGHPMVAQAVGGEQELFSYGPVVRVVSPREVDFINLPTSEQMTEVARFCKNEPRIWWDVRSITGRHLGHGEGTLGDLQRGLASLADKTASAKQIRRMPKQRRMEFVPERPLSPSKNDVLKAIKRYRFQSIKSQPFPLYLVVYDNMGRPKGTLSLGPGFHNELLKMQYKKKGSVMPEDVQRVIDAVTAGGGKFIGVGDMDLVYFNTPHNPSTLVLGIDEVTPEVVKAKIQWSVDAYAAAVMRRDKRAGQWGLRSYDDDSAHDILDRYRPKGDESQLGFDEPVPEDQLPDLVAELNSMDLGTPDAKQDYLAVVIFLMTHGSDIPDDLRQCALGIAHELHGDTEGGNPGGKTDSGYKLWKDPMGRKKELEKEMAILEGDESKVASLWGIEKVGRFLREDEMIAWAHGAQDDYYANHPELGGHGRLMVREPGSTPVPLEKAVRADYTNAEGYWVGEGNAASGILPICMTTGRVCLAWRSPHVNEGSCFGTIGGAVKRGMQPKESAQEELQEETGYTGGISLHPAYVFNDRGRFKYFNFLGEVPTEFGFNPQEDHAWETEAIEWMTFEEVQQQIKDSPHDFHRGVILLFQKSGKIIQQICNRAGRGKGNGKQDSGNVTANAV